MAVFPTLHWGHRRNTQGATRVSLPARRAFLIGRLARAEFKRLAHTGQSPQGAPGPSGSLTTGPALSLSQCRPHPVTSIYSNGRSEDGARLRAQTPFTFCGVAPR